AWSTVGMLDVRRKSLNEGGRDIQSLTSTTSERFTRQYAAASGATLEVIWILESYEIAFPGFETFRTRLVEKSAELSTKFGNLHSALLGYLAMTLPGHERQGTMTIVPPPPDTAKLDELRTLSDSLREVEFDIHMYLSDLRVAAQNHLLAGIFPGYRAKERRPDDPRFEVLRPMLGPSRSGRSSRSTPV
ncbi:MAG: hypothetical protein FJY85_16655, partial [Deltaproteobacteria bacterium]|nr:hypothetical protein [Deltaproteobacteria bacterium]